MAENNRNTLTVETEKIREVYAWTVKLCGEEDNTPPYVPAEWYRVFRKLQMAQGILLKVVGAQGIGKTTMAKFLEGGLDKKTTRLRRMQKGYEKFGKFELNKWLDEITDMEDRVKRKIVMTDKDWDWDYSDIILNLIVDMWDYSKNNQKDITKALDAIQDYWIHRCSENKRNKTPLINIVIFLQKEALPLHFFLGKMELLELQPIQPDALILYYNWLFKTCAPFTEEALKEVAFCSGGIFRKFKQYIATCIELLFDYGRKNKTITLEDVKKVTTAEKISKDMELQLSEIYPRSKENRVLSVKVLRYIREFGETNQKTIEEQFFEGNKMACSRLLNTLCTYDYLAFRNEGVERIWKIAEVKKE